MVGVCLKATYSCAVAGGWRDTQTHTKRSSSPEHDKKNKRMRKHLHPTWKGNHHILSKGFKSKDYWRFAFNHQAYCDATLQKTRRYAPFPALVPAEGNPAIWGRHEETPEAQTGVDVNWIEQEVKVPAVRPWTPEPGWWPLTKEISSGLCRPWRQANRIRDNITCNTGKQSPNVGHGLPTMSEQTGGGERRKGFQRDVGKVCSSVRRDSLCWGENKDFIAECRLYFETQFTPLGLSITVSVQSTFTQKRKIENWKDNVHKV